MPGACPFPLQRPRQVYTSSYEGVVRCFDANAGKFLETAVYDDQDMLAYADVAWARQTLFGCHRDGGTWDR